MNWFLRFLTSSIGQKLIMSLTGLFLITFLIVHLAGNLQLLAGDGGEAFNVYAKFMTTNPLIKTTSYGLYFFILLHAVQGIALWLKNRKARGNQKYAVTATRGATGANPKSAKMMGYLGLLLLAFLMIHMGDFWWAMKRGQVEMVTYGGESYQDLYSKVLVSFKNPLVVVAYVIGMVALFFHLRHGFWSAFQTLGLNHPKYTSLIRMTGTLLAVVLPLAFAAIPLYMFFMM